MSASFKSISGIAYPEDMTLLKQVFDRICQTQGFANGSLEAEDLSKATMELFNGGVVEEAELLGSLEEYMRRKSGAKRIGL